LLSHEFPDGVQIGRAKLTNIYDEQFLWNALVLFELSIHGVIE